MAFYQSSFVFLCIVFELSYLVVIIIIIIIIRINYIITLLFVLLFVYLLLEYYYTETIVEFLDKNEMNA